MRTNHLRTWLVASTLFFSGSLAFSAVPTAEDLTGCHLPNGRAVLPALGTSLAKDGSLFKFSNQVLSTLPAMEEGKPLSAEQTLAKIQSGNLGDLQYLLDSKGNATLLASSGYITDVPRAVYLADTTGKKIDEPLALPKTSRNLAGQFPGIEEGNVYLLKTTEGRFVLLRVLEQTKEAIVVQYVYQPNGTTIFDIPVHGRIPYTRPNEAQPAATQVASTPAVATATAPAPAVPPGSAIASISPIPTGAVDPTFSGTGAIGNPDLSPPPAPPTRTVLPPALTTPLGPGDINDSSARVIRIVSSANPPVVPIAPAAPVIPRPITTPTSIMAAPAPVTGAALLDPSIDTLVQQRSQIIQHRLDILAAPAKSGAEIERKSQAMLELGFLRADDPAVADALVNDIAFVNTRTPVKEFSPDALYPALAALKRLGKPGADAALRGLHRLDLEAAGAEADAPVYRVKLLANVIRSIEGDDVADFIFRREASHETDPKRKAVFEYLLNN